ncbi:MAG: sodium-dependent transporter [Anaerolineae bacterium]|jgi:NSS family neurotransmitter:Na+ symporter
MTSAGPRIRGRFTGTLGAVAATLGSAVGLGNIWKFPYMTGESGGAAFVIVYVIATFLIGLPVMISEHVIGRTARSDAIGSLRKLAPKEPWWLIGVAGVLSAFLITAFYTEVIGWVLVYILKAFTGQIVTTDPAVTGAAFGSVIGSPWISLISQWVVLAGLTAIIIAGVSRGIEAMVKRLLPILFVILVVIAIRSVTLPGASAGLEFLFKPDLTKLSLSVVLAAMGLAFFKLSVGMGTMITYGSYYPDEQNIPQNAVRVMLGDLFVSLLAGVAIFPAVFAFGVEKAAGPSLMFITMPTVFSSMPGGPVVQSIFMGLFFVLAACAATGAALSLFEVPVAYLEDRAGWTRKKAAITTAVALAVAGALPALAESWLSGVRIGGLNLFDAFDFASSNILLPVGGLFLCIFLGWRWGWPQVKEGLTNRGTLGNQAMVTFFYGVAKFISPVLILVVLLGGLGLFG